MDWTDEILLASRDAEIRNLERKVEALQRNLNTATATTCGPANQRIKELESLNQGWQERVDELTNTNHHVIKDRDELLVKLEGARAQIEELRKSNTRATINRLDQELESLRAKLADANKLAEERKGLIEKLQMSLNLAQERYPRLTATEYMSKLSIAQNEATEYKAEVMRLKELANNRLTEVFKQTRRADDLMIASQSDHRTIAEQQEKLDQFRMDNNHQGAHPICPGCYDAGYQAGRNGEAKVAGQNLVPSFVAGRNVGYAEGYKRALKKLSTYCMDEERDLDV